MDARAFDFSDEVVPAFVAYKVGCLQFSFNRNYVLISRFGKNYELNTSIQFDLTPEEMEQAREDLRELMK